VSFGPEAELANSTFPGLEREYAFIRIAALEAEIINRGADGRDRNHSGGRIPHK
jgi:hypothetical protein